MNNNNNLHDMKKKYDAESYVDFMNNFINFRMSATRVWPKSTDKYMKEPMKVSSTCTTHLLYKKNF